MVTAPQRRPASYRPMQTVKSVRMGEAAVSTAAQGSIAPINVQQSMSAAACRGRHSAASHRHTACRTRDGQCGLKTGSGLGTCNLPSTDQVYETGQHGAVQVQE